MKAAHDAQYSTQYHRGILGCVFFHSSHSARRHSIVYTVYATARPQAVRAPPIIKRPPQSISQRHSEPRHPPGVEMRFNGQSISPTPIRETPNEIQIIICNHRGIFIYFLIRSIIGGFSMRVRSRSAQVRIPNRSRTPTRYKLAAS